MNPILVVTLRVLIALGMMLVNGVVLIYMLRKVLGHLHLRLGPMDNGWRGTLQTVWDVLKLLTKEDPTPAAVDKSLFFIAPAIVVIPSLAAYAALPFGPNLAIADFELGLLFTFAVMAIIPLGILMAGWASNNKWSLIGAMRAVGGQVTYEVPMLIAALPVVMMARSLNMGDIVAAQQSVWFVVNLPAFILFFIAGLIESNQTPFDLAEAESELVCGFATEYSAMKFGLLFLSEFSNLFIFAALLVTLFFGGWLVPFVPADVMAQVGFVAPVVFIFKTYVVIAVLMVIRGTLPRVRVDQLLNLGWKFLLPASMVWFMVTALVLKLGSVWFGGVQ